MMKMNANLVRSLRLRARQIRAHGSRSGRLRRRWCRRVPGVRVATWPASTPDPDLSGSRTISNSKSLHRCGLQGTPPGCGRENIDFTYYFHF